MSKVYDDIDYPDDEDMELPYCTCEVEHDIEEQATECCKCCGKPIE